MILFLKSRMQKCLQCCVHDSVFVRCDHRLFSCQGPCFPHQIAPDPAWIRRQMSFCRRAAAGTGRCCVKEVGSSVGGERRGSARHVGNKICLCTWLWKNDWFSLCTHADRLWGDWRSVEHMQVQMESMGSLLQVYWIVRPHLSPIGHLNKGHFWIYLLTVSSCHKVPIMLLVS